jgi:glycosyltransferase involved in cell wall biosynthesis
MATPRISVIIPVFNGERTLARAVQSVLDQSFPAHEIIVVDDGSSDATARVVQRLGDRVQAVRQENRGVSAARNFGVARATGDWVAFLDADDWYYPDRLRLHAEWIASGGAPNLLTGDYDYVDGDGRRLGGSIERTACGRRIAQRADRDARVVLEAPEMAEFVADHFGDTHTLTARRADFLEVGGYPPGFRVCEDVVLLIRLCARLGRIGVVCRALGAYAIHDQSATRRDRLDAQRENVRTLSALKAEASAFPRNIRQGYRERLRRARLDLAAALLRHGRGGEALSRVLPSLIEQPGVPTLRDVASVAVDAVRRTRGAAT